ncbi:TPA: hypothetical protein ACX6PV_000742 [Photobacterium damselae]
MKFNLEKWIEENSYEQSYAYNAPKVVDVDDLRELLKTHAIVPREPSREMLTAGSSPLFSIPLKRIGITRIYKAMIAEAEKR